MCGYRQWKLPSEMNIIDSHKPEQQMERYLCIAAKIELIAKKGQPCLISWDSNIDLN